METKLNSAITVIDDCIFGDSQFSFFDQLKPTQEVLPGICWGYYGKLFTPAYWKIQYLMHSQNDSFSIQYKLGNNILEEVVACLLGGFGLKAETGLAAFDRMVNRNLIKEGIDYQPIFSSLEEPFSIAGKKVRYRFPNQKAKFIFQFLNRTDLKQIPLSNDLTFRKWLMSVNGIGPKTASWITRNYLNSENVAIIDIHIFRAGLIAGIFSEKLDVQKDYFKLEQIFIDFCKAIQVQPSKMDALMWLQMKESNRIAINAIKQS